MSELVIVGCGGFGREVQQYASDMLKVGKADFDRVAGVLDDHPEAVAQVLAAKGVRPGFVESIAGHRVRDDYVYVIAVGLPALRVAFAGRLAADAIFTRILHPTAYVAPSATIEPGAVLCPYAFVGPNARIGRHAALNTFASSGHDSSVGACSVLSPYAVINGDVILEDEVFMGTHATVQPGLTVGRRSSIAAGSVVTRSVAPGSLALGNPAKQRVMYKLDV